MPPRAAPHSNVGTGAEGTAQAAGGCPHHLCQDREQALSMTACPGVPQPGTQDPSAGLRPTRELRPACLNLSGWMLCHHGQRFVTHQRVISPCPSGRSLCCPARGSLAKLASMSSRVWVTSLIYPN